MESPHSFRVFPKLDSLMKQEKVTFVDLWQELNSVSNGDIKKITFWPDSHTNAFGTKCISNEIVKQWDQPKYLNKRSN